MVFQWPCGTVALSRSPRGAQPRSGAMLVLVQVSSMNTRRDGSIRPWYFTHCARRRATSGRVPLGRDQRLFLCVSPSAWTNSHTER